MGQVGEKLSKDYSDKEFQKMFHRSKPTFDTELIFMCKIGKRSHNAMEISRKLGYKKYDIIFVNQSRKFLNQVLLQLEELFGILDRMGSKGRTSQLANADEMSSKFKSISKLFSYAVSSVYTN